MEELLIELQQAQDSNYTGSEWTDDVFPTTSFGFVGETVDESYLDSLLQTN
jgi:hypothetical protein